MGRAHGGLWRWIAVAAAVLVSGSAAWCGGGEPEASADPNRLTVVEATWGAGNSTRNVTEEARKHAGRYHLWLRVDGKLLGPDPAFGKHKEFTIAARLGDETVGGTYRDFDEVLLAAPLSAGQVRGAVAEAGGGELAVLEALWHDGAEVKDVTEVVRAQVDGRWGMFRLTPELLGIGGERHESQAMSVAYALDGELRAAAYRLGKVALLGGQAKNALPEELNQHAALVYSFDAADTFEEGGHQWILDLSGRGNHGKVVGLELTDGVAGRALRMVDDGSRHVMSAKKLGISGNRPRTIAFWLRNETRHTKNWRVIIGWGADGRNRKWTIATEPNGYRLWAGGARHDWLPKVPLERGWHHHVIVTANGVTRWYVDGTLRDERRRHAYKTKDSTLWVGHTAGAVDELAVFDNLALNPQWVKRMYELSRRGLGAAGRSMVAEAEAPGRMKREAVEVDEGAARPAPVVHPPSADPNRLTVVEATWGAGNSTRNVTEEARKHTGRYHLWLRVDGKLLGPDPAFGKHKEFAIAARLGDETVGGMYRDFDEVLLAAPLSAGQVRGAVAEAGGSELAVLEALWHDGTEVKDVTDVVRSEVEGRWGMFRLTPELLGIGGERHESQAMSVAYALDGEVRATAYRLGEVVLLGEAASRLVRFAPVDLEHPVTSMAVTEDGAFLVATHQQQDRVTFWDVRTQEAATLATKAPLSVLSRGDFVFVSNEGEGTISAFSRRGEWRLVNQYRVGHAHPRRLSAPKGSHFDRQLLVTAHAGGADSYKNPHVFLLDLREDRSREVASASAASFSTDGRLIFFQSSFHLSPSGNLEVMAAEDVLADRADPIFGVGKQPYLYQAHDALFWFGDDRVVAGYPAALIGETFEGAVLIPDAAEPVVYELRADQLVRHRLDRELTVEGVRRVELPPETAGDFGRFADGRERERAYLLDHPVAYEREGRLHLFAIDHPRQRVLYSQTGAFDEGDERLAEMLIEPETSEPTDNERLNLPAELTALRPFSRKLRAEQPGARFELLSGPEGVELSAAGVLSWRPGESDIGRRELKIRVTADEEMTILRPVFEVLSPPLLAQEHVAAGGRLDLEPDHHLLTAGPGYEHLLLLQGRTLKVLGADGLTVTAMHELPGRYRLIAERDRHYVALATNVKPAVLDVLEKASLRPVKSIEVDAMAFLDLAAHPTRPVSYVAAKTAHELPRFHVLEIDESRGEAHRHEDLYGNWVEMDPTGQVLYTGYSDLYVRGSRLHINPDLRVIETPMYESVEIVFRYDIRGGSPRMVEFRENVGGNGQGLVLSPDGSRLAYLSHVGLPLHSGNVPAFDTSRLDAEPVYYAAKTHDADGKTVAFHPSLPWAAVPTNTNSAVLFHRESGEALTNKLRLSSEGLEGVRVERVMFSPDGRGLIFQCVEPAGVRHLRRVALRLSADEEAEVARGPKIPKAGDAAAPLGEAPAPPRVRMADLDGLRAPRAAGRLNAQQLAERYMQAVVIVHSREGFGTGFFIGRRGWVMTSAHVLPTRGPVNVSYLTSYVNGDAQFARTEADVIRADHRQDIALLKIRGDMRTPFVALAGQELPAVGQSVTVIGNPGLGEQVLNHTITTGVVSNPKRVIRGMPHIQLSAAVNPGNSGGPMFDDRGRVIGLVVLKAEIDDTGFAVPAAELRRFLLEAAPR